VEREAFLSRVRAATGAPTPAAPPEFLSPSPPGDREAALALMEERWRRPRAAWYRVAQADAAAAVVAIVAGAGARRVALSADPLLASLGVAEALGAAGVACIDPPRTLEGVHAALPHADAGVTVPAYAVAETGTLVEVARPDQPRSLSLLPPIHVAVLRAEAVLPTLDDLFAALSAAPAERTLTLISGPSGTADIGLQHVTGVHGPGDVHLIVVDDAAPVLPGAGRRQGTPA